MSEKLYANEYLYIEEENATIPWIQIFSQTPYKSSVTAMKLPAKHS